MSKKKKCNKSYSSLNITIYLSFAFLFTQFLTLISPTLLVICCCCCYWFLRKFTQEMIDFCWHKCGNFHWKCNQVPRCAYTASDEFVYLTVLFFSSLLLAFRILTAFLREIYAGFSFFFDILASLINFFLLFKRGNNLFILNIKKKILFFRFCFSHVGYVFLFFVVEADYACVCELTNKKN